MDLRNFRNHLQLIFDSSEGEIKQDCQVAIHIMEMLINLYSFPSIKFITPFGIMNAIRHLHYLSEDAIESGTKFLIWEIIKVSERN